MACTIVSTPATGAADWTGWITQQGLTDRGFSRISLTNFATTAASVIGTGSVFELAGSIYNNTTETSITLATGTASASVAVYIMAIPAAGGTTCTFQLDSTAPTWIDAKQGFYASAASTTRALGGMAIGTAATYFNKWLYSPEDGSRPIKTIIIEIGDWNMQGTTAVTVVHNLALSNMRAVNVLVRLDGDGDRVPLTFSTGGDPSAGTIGGRFSVTTAGVACYRFADGFFNGPAFNSTSYNRGWIVIEYEV